jgi:hypothetical protein
MVKGPSFARLTPWAKGRIIGERDRGVSRPEIRRSVRKRDGSKPLLTAIDNAFWAFAALADTMPASSGATVLPSTPADRTTTEQVQNNYRTTYRTTTEQLLKIGSGSIRVFLRKKLLSILFRRALSITTVFVSCSVVVL